MAFKKILCPIDFSPGSQQSMRAAIRVANESDAELVLMHAWYVPPFAFPGGYAFPSDVIQAMVDDAQRGLDAAVRDATTFGGAKRVTAKLVTGVPWSGIVEVLDAQAFDLVVMGTHGRTGLARVLLGSVAEKVMRHAPCSTLAIRPEVEVTPFKHVLCPVDFSESSQCAVDLAAEVVHPGGTGITLMHVVEVPVAYSRESVTDGLSELEERSTELLEIWATRLRGKVSVPVSTQLRIGRPGADVLAVLDKDRTIDLVVMGSHGKTGLKRVLLGSVAEKVVRHAGCPVLVARKRA